MDEHKENASQLDTVQKKKRKHPLLRLLLLLLLVLAVILGALWLDGRGFDGLRRLWSYSRVETDENGLALFGQISSESDDRYALLGDGLVILSQNRLQAFNESGQVIYEDKVNFSSPALAQGGGMAAAYSIGGDRVLLLTGKGLLKTLDGFQGLISAKLNDAGYLAVVDGKGGYKGIVSVYTPQGEKLFDFQSASRYLMDACVTGDNKYVAVSSLGQEDSVFISNVLLYRLSDAQLVGSYCISDGLTLEMRGCGTHVLTVADSCFAVGNHSGNLLQNVSFSGQYLREYSLDGDDFCALLLGRYRSGSIAALSTYDNNGQLLASLPLTEEVRGISAKGKYLAVLYSDRVVIYTRELEEYASLSQAEYAKAVRMRSDGSLLLIGASQVWLYLP